jgi:hypothetical protein
MAARLGEGDPVDHLEPVFDDLCATLHSPKPNVRHTVAKLAGALSRAQGGELAANDVQREIVLAMGEAPTDGADQPTHPRRIYVG